MTIECRAGARIFRQGDLAESVFYAESGRFTATSVTPNGKIALLAVISAAEFFGEDCRDDGSRRTYTVQTVEAGCVWRCSRRLFEQLLHTEPEFVAGFVTHMIAVTRRFERRVRDSIACSSETRLAAALVTLSAPAGGGTRVCSKISHEMLASFVGTTRPRISFFMGRLRARGLVVVDGDRLIIQESLKDLASENEGNELRREPRTVRRAHATSRGPAAEARHLR